MFSVSILQATLNEPPISFFICRPKCLTDPLLKAIQRPFEISITALFLKCSFVNRRMIV